MEEISCRMCGKTASECKGCGWVEELENAEGGICRPCLHRFMGGYFKMTLADGQEIFGEVPTEYRSGEFHNKVVTLERFKLGPDTAKRNAEAQKEPEETGDKRLCRYDGGPLDGQLFSRRGQEVKSLAHLGPPMGVYTFKDQVEIDGREIWTWKEHGP